jgi:hypothetical protein
VAACRTQALHELTGADKVDTDAGRSHWTLDADTALDIGRADTRRADAGHVPDAGHWTRAGRRTLDGRTLWTCGRGQGDQGTVGRRPVLLWAAHAALGNHDGSTVRYLPARDCRLYCHAAAGSRRRRPSGASAHCCPRKNWVESKAPWWLPSGTRGRVEGWFVALIGTGCVARCWLACASAKAGRAEWCASRD